jgi:hypothetical protein
MASKQSLTKGNQMPMSAVRRQQFISGTSQPPLLRTGRHESELPGLLPCSLHFFDDPMAQQEPSRSSQKYE